MCTFEGEGSGRRRTIGAWEEPSCSLHRHLVSDPRRTAAPEVDVGDWERKTNQ